MTTNAPSVVTQKLEPLSRENNMQNFLTDFFTELDRRVAIRANNDRLNAIMALREKNHCDHTPVVHRNHDGCDRHQCTKCGNVEIKLTPA
jgi:hypothetical protein